MFATVPKLVDFKSNESLEISITSLTTELYLPDSFFNVTLYVNLIFKSSELYLKPDGYALDLKS